MCDPKQELFSRYRKYWPDYLRRAFMVRDYKLEGHLRSIFDALSDPRYAELDDTKVCQRANEINSWNARQKRGEVTWKVFMCTEADVVTVRELIMKDINLARARSVIMTDWMESLYFPKQFLKAIQEAETIEDPKEFINSVKSLYGHLIQRKKEYGKEFVDKNKLYGKSREGGEPGKPLKAVNDDDEPEIYPDL